MAEQRQENNKPTKGTIEIWGRRSLPGTMRQTTKSRAYSFMKAIFAAAPRRWALNRFSRSFPNWTVLGKKDRRSLEVAAAVPWFWRKDCQSLPTFISFMYVSMGGMSGKALCGAKNPAETRTTPKTAKSTSKWAILPNQFRITWSGFHTPFVFENKKQEE